MSDTATEPATAEAAAAWTHDGYEMVVGLEVHVELDTKTKLFSASPHRFGDEPNTNIDPVTLGLPGALPVLNRAAVEHGEPHRGQPSTRRHQGSSALQGPQQGTGLTVLGATRVRSQRTHRSTWASRGPRRRDRR